MYQVAFNRIGENIIRRLLLLEKKNGLSYMYLYKYENVCLSVGLSVCLSVHVDLIPLSDQ